MSFWIVYCIESSWTHSFVVPTFMMDRSLPGEDLSLKGFQSLKIELFKTPRQIFKRFV